MTYEELQVTERLNRCTDLGELDAVQFEFSFEIDQSIYLLEIFDNTFDRLQHSVNVRRMY